MAIPAPVSPARGNPAPKGTRRPGDPPQAGAAAPAYRGMLFATRAGWVAAIAGPAGVAALTLPGPDPDAARAAAAAALPRGSPRAVAWLDAPGEPAAWAGPAADLLAAVAAQVREYLEGRRTAFAFPLDFGDRPAFTRRVLAETARIPYGEVRSYGQLAAAAGRPGAARAVGQVMANNPICLAVPCHRVVGWDGRLTGFGGGLALKRRLLGLEGARRPPEPSSGVFRE